jgi:hypothetical protein
MATMIITDCTDTDADDDQIFCGGESNYLVQILKKALAGFAQITEN